MTTLIKKRLTILTYIALAMFVLTMSLVGIWGPEIEERCKSDSVEITTFGEIAAFFVWHWTMPIGIFAALLLYRSSKRMSHSAVLTLDLVMIIVSAGAILAYYFFPISIIHK